MNPAEQVNNVYQAVGAGVPWYTNTDMPTDQFQGQQPTQQTYSAPAPVDPYAQWGGRAAYDSLVSGFNTQKSNIYGSANEAAQNQGLSLGNSIQDLVGGLQSGQRNIDNSAVNNELAKRQGRAGVLGMVSRGIKSGGVQLANKNATDSSAAEALARAYGQVGQRQMSQVGNQYEAGNRDIAAKQQDLIEQQAAGVRRINTSKEQIINSIVSEARNQLGSLDAQMASASLPDRINIEQEKNAIRDQVLAKLQQYDTQLNQGVAGIKPTSIDERRAKAIENQMAGVASPTQFDYTSQEPGQWQNTGPFASELPIFTFRGRRQT